MRKIELFRGPRLFVDMDGTLARFHDEVEYLERMTESGFFLFLRPFKDVVEGINRFCKEHPECEVYILSSVIGEDCVAEKNAWVDRFLPDIPRKNRLFPLVGTSKAEFVARTTGELVCSTDFLLDDYTKNLLEWARDGGTGIKLVNNINRNNGGIIP